MLSLLLAAAPSSASAHPLGNYTVNRAVVIEIGGQVELRYIVDMAEIPAFEVIQQIDADGDGAVGSAEGAAFAGEYCAARAAGLEVAMDGSPVELGEAAAPRLDFPAGAGGLPTLRLECRFERVSGPNLNAGDDHELSVQDGTDDGRIGWREVTARASGNAAILLSDVPPQSESGYLTAYPGDRLEAPPDVRTGSIRFKLGTDGTPPPAETTGSVDPRQTASDPLAALVGGPLSPAIIALALLLSLGLGAIHAVSPGHGKTLVAAYVLGAGGTARSAMQIGIWVAISHTAGVFVLGILTLVASQLFLPERVIGWLSLASGIVVIGLGIVLLWRFFMRRAAPSHDAHHSHDQPHAHPHEAPTSAAISWRSALALGFAGGAVPSASALIVLLVAISTDRLLFGVVLIATFGIGMAAVLGGLAFVVARVGRYASRSTGRLNSPLIRRASALIPVAAGLAVLATGIAFSVIAAGRLA